MSATPPIVADRCARCLLVLEDLPGTPGSPAILRCPGCARSYHAACRPKHCQCGASGELAVDAGRMSLPGGRSTDWAQGRTVRAGDPTPEVIRVGQVNTRPEVMLPLLFVLLVSTVANHRSLPLFLILVSSAVVLYRDLVHPRWSFLFFAQALAADFDELVAGVRELRPVAITTAVLLLASAVIAPSAVGGLLGAAAFWLLAYHLTLLNVLAEPMGESSAGGRADWLDQLREKISQPAPTWMLGLASTWISLYGLLQLAGLSKRDPTLAGVRWSQFPLSLLIPAVGVGAVAGLARWWASNPGRDDPRFRHGRVGLMLSGVTLWVAVAMVALIVFPRAGLKFPFEWPELNALVVVGAFGGGCLVLRLRRLGAAPASATGVSLGGIATAGAPLLPLVGWLLWRAADAGSEDRESSMSFGLVALVIVIWAVGARFWARLPGTDAEESAVSWVCFVVGVSVLLLAGVVASAFGKGTDLLVVGALMTWGWVRQVGNDLHGRG